MWQIKKKKTLKVFKSELELISETVALSKVVEYRHEDALPDRHHNHKEAQQAL